MRARAALALVLWLALPSHTHAQPPEPAELPPPPSEPLIIERVHLAGVRVGRRTPMRAKINIARGTPLDEHAVEDARLRLIASGLCEQVAVRLDRGSARGRVRLVFTCQERVTTSLDAMHLGHARPTRFWAGAEVSDLDPLGVGIGVGAGLVASEAQLATRLALTFPAPAGLDGKLRIGLRYLGGEEPFIGPRGQTLAGLAVGHVPVPYRRAGADATIHLDLGPFLRWSTGLSAEWVDADVPTNAKQIDADGITRPFDFALDPALALALRGALVWDRRDDPAWPTRGRRASLIAHLGAYDGPWASLAGRFEQYLRLPWGSVLQLDLYLGALAGGAPFFERFFVGDLHPYIPARALGLNFSRRRGPKLIDAGGLDRARYETLAGRAGFEYRVPLGAGPTAEPYGVEFFVSAGLISLASPGEPGAFDDGPPFDLAVDVGLRFETEIGVMGLSVGNLFLLVEP